MARKWCSLFTKWGLILKFFCIPFSFFVSKQNIRNVNSKKWMVIVRKPRWWGSLEEVSEDDWERFACLVHVGNFGSKIHTIFWPRTKKQKNLCQKLMQFENCVNHSHTLTSSCSRFFWLATAAIFAIRLKRPSSLHFFYFIWHKNLVVFPTPLEIIHSPLKPSTKSHKDWKSTTFKSIITGWSEKMRWFYDKGEGIMIENKVVKNTLAS